MYRHIWKWGLAVAVTAIGGVAVDAQTVVYNGSGVRTQTLQMTGDDAQTTPVHFFRRHYQPYYRYSYSYRPTYSYRPYYHSYRPYYGYSYSYGYRPSYHYSYRYSYYPTYRYYSYRPYVSSYYGYYGPCSSSPAVIITLGQPAVQPLMPTVPENPNATPDNGKKKMQYPYDGGPKNPVPMPPPDPGKPATEPKNAEGNSGFLVSFPPPAPPDELAYPGFGEIGDTANVVTPPTDNASVQTIPVNREASRENAPAPAFEYPAYGER